MLELASSYVTAVSSATKTISVAPSASLPNTIMSSSACVTSAEQQKVSGTEENQKGIRDSNENGASRIVRVEERRDKTKPEKEKASHKRDNRDKERNRHSSSGKGKSKENYDERASEKKDSVKIRRESKDKYTNKDNDKDNEKISKENKDKYSNNESEKNNRKSNEDRNYKGDKMSSKDKSGKKGEKEKHRSKDTKQRYESGQKDKNSNSKDARQRHESEQRRERERHSSSGSMLSETQNKEKNPKETSNIKKNVQNLSNITSTKTTSSSTVTCSSALPVVTSLVTSSGEVSTNVSLVNAGQSAPKVKKTVSIASTIATTTATVTMSRNTTKSTSVVKTTTSTHIQSSVLLQVGIIFITYKKFRSFIVSLLPTFLIKKLNSLQSTKSLLHKCKLLQLLIFTLDFKAMSQNFLSSTKTFDIILYVYHVDGHQSDRPHNFSVDVLLFIIYIFRFTPRLNSCLEYSLFFHRNKAS